MLKNGESPASTINRHKIRGYIPVNIELNPKYEYLAVNVVGNCLDSDLSPMRIKNGDRVVVHSVPVTEPEIMKCIGKIVSFILTNGQSIIKQAVFYDDVNRTIIVRYLNPKDERFYIPINKIKEMFVVDKVLSCEYVEQNIIKLNDLSN